MPYRLLITGFDAFGELPDNPAHRLAEALARQELPGLSVTARTVPTAYEASAEMLEQALASEAFDGLVMLGLAQNSPVVRLETTALNVADASLADNVGEKREGAPLRKNGPHAVTTDLPLTGLVRALQDKGHPVKLSHSAGTFVCNALYYAALTSPQRPRDVLFVHIPATEACLPTTGAWTHPIMREAYVESILRDLLLRLPRLRA